MSSRFKFGGYLPCNSDPSTTYAAGLLVAALSGYPFQRKVEPAGDRYEYIKRKVLAKEYIDNEEETSSSNNTAGAEEDAETNKEESAKYEKKRHKKNEIMRSLLNDDPYEIMGLGHLRWRATEDDIRSAYRKLVLKYHPDKNEGIDDEIFKKISNANNVLSDPKKRKMFDSQEEDDDFPLPTGNEKGDFFQIFGKVFDRFSRWSVNPSVPPLGDASTPYEQVVAFYNFWFDFKSWRDFSFSDEFDPNEADSRDERRWMERQNERERKKKKKEEAQRIFKLTETAERCDPRIKAHKDQQKLEKEKAKQAKIDEKKKKQEEMEKRAAMEKAKKEEEEKRKAEEEAQLRKQQQEETKMKNKQRGSLRHLAQVISPAPNSNDVDTLCSKLSLTQLTALVKVLEKKDPAESKKAFYAELEPFKQEERQKELAKQAAKKEEASKGPWTDDELSLLAQAVAKFPGGVTDRWDKIAEYVGTRTVKEIIAKTKETKFVSAKPVVHDDAFTRFTKTKKKSDKDIKSEISVRDEGELAAQSSTAPAPTPATAEKKPAEWSVAEQKALEKALQTFPSTLSDRWDKIAEAVPGRSKKDCIQRYKYIVEQIKQKKATS